MIVLVIRVRKKIISFILKKNSYNKEYSKIELNVIKYKMECLYTFLTKFILLLLLTTIFKIQDVFLLLVLLMWPLRAFGFGFHSNTNKGCWITTTIMYFIIPIIIKFVAIPFNLMLIFGVLFLSSIILFAPAGTNKKPLLNKNKNFKRKIIISVICLIYFWLIIIIKNSELKELIFVAISYQSFLVNPITYYFFDKNFKKQNHKYINWF